MNTAESPAPSWMRWWLVAAGLYNLIWGAIMIALPQTSLRLLGVNPSTNELWPQLWACIGMIVGVYGIGYLAASRDPLRHWPIVLVGLIGKILGPIGFLDAALRGVLPWSMGATILTNDLVWWVPFSMMLWAAFRSSQPPQPAEAVTLDTALSTLRDQDGRTLAEVTADRITLVVLLRHAGCTFCREALADLAAQQPELASKDRQLAVVGLSTESASLQSAGEARGLRSARYFADPDRLLYRALELKRGTFMQLFGPSVWVRGATAMLRGHMVGKLEGDGFQMPGAFVIHKGRVLAAYRHATASDRPNYEKLACSIQA